MLTNKRDDSGRKMSKAGWQEEALVSETLEKGMQELWITLDSPSIPRAARELPLGLPAALQPHQGEERPWS